MAIGSAEGRMKAPVAPSPARDVDRPAAGFSTAVLDDCGIESTGAIGVTIGVGATKTGSGSEGAFPCDTGAKG